MRTLRIDYWRPPDRRSQFEMDLLYASHELIIARDVLEPREPIAVDGEVLVAIGDVATWFLFKNKTFDVARVTDADGNFKGFYVDALETVRWTGADTSTLEPLTDLFIDLWIWPDFRCHILDEDELSDAQSREWVSEAQAHQARQTIAQIIAQIEIGQFPPDVVREYAEP